MKKVMLLLGGIFCVSSSYASNLESPLYMAKKETLYLKAYGEIPTQESTDFVMGEEFGYGITSRIMVYEKLGFSVGDKLAGTDQFLSDLLLGANFRLIDSNIKLDLLTSYSLGISKKYAIGSVYDNVPSSFGKSDQNVFGGLRVGGKIRESIMIAGRLGYNYYFSDPEIGGFKLENDDLSSLNFGFEVAFQIIEAVSMNFSLDRFEHSNNHYDQTVVGAKLNYHIKDNMMLSGYVAYDAEEDDDEMTFGLKFGWEI